jgi:hypothetical protein
VEKNMAPFLLKLIGSLVLFTSNFSAASASEAVETKTKPAGSAKTTDTKALEAGARLLQRNSPLHGFDMYLVGFHPMKDPPKCRWKRITIVIK